jgi:putative transcriptional regulator
VESYQGRALVASPYLTDQNFMRTVLYLIRHDEEGAMGLVLNRPLATNIGQLLGELTETSIENQQPVFFGGPVDGPIMMLQANCVGAESEDTEIFIACDQAKILEVVHNEAPNVLGFRLFDGYSGWGPGQLESEMEEGSWLIWDINPEQIFSESDQLWQEAVVQIGRGVIAGGLGDQQFCCNPDHN